MTGTWCERDLCAKGADKGQVLDPSAAPYCDPSPEEDLPGRSIVSDRVPAFTVTSPSLLLLQQPAHVHPLSARLSHFRQ